MNFEWNKRRENIRKHGIDFADLPPLFGGVIITIEDARFDYGESRYITLGLLKHHVIVVVHTDRNGNMRIISARKATKNESRRYFE